jgi:NADH-quinone oxidoreductase subunit L
MMLGLGVGAWLPAVFHIFTHAFFKCCLFLCAGSVSHSGSHHSFDMKKDMGGLRKKMPVTFAAWIISTLALTGVFPFAGFWSKDEIIDNVGHNGYTFLMWVGLGGAALTAMYMTRATYLTFFGEPRGAAAGEHDHHEDEHDLFAEEHELETLTVGAPEPPPGVVLDSGSAVHGGVSGTGSGADAGHDHHDEGDDHHEGPHESGPLILIPIVILALFALTAGFLNATPLGEDWEQIKKYVEPSADLVVTEELQASGPGEMVVQIVPTADSGEEEGGEGHSTGCGFETPEPGTACFFPAVSHAEPKFAKILLSLAVVAAGYALAIAFCLAYYGRRDERLEGLSRRSSVLGAGLTFLERKYYLDDLYEKGVVHAVAHPIAAAANWINQHVIDGIVNGTGRAAKRFGQWTYRWVDQGLVDGAVNASGTVASETGHAMQPMQSGRVNLYSALLFGAATVGAIVLVLVNVS